MAETLKHRIGVRAVLDYLDRDALLELRVGTLSQIDGAHPAAATLADDTVSADLSFVGRHRRCNALDVRRRLRDEAACLLMRGQQAFDLFSQSRIAAARTRDECLSFERRAVERSMKDVFELVPPFR